MLRRTILLAAALFAGAPLLAQTSSTGALPEKAPVRQPGVPAHPAATASANNPPAAADRVDPAKDAAIRHLMDLTQTSKLADDINAYITKQVRDALSQALPPDRLAKFMQTFGEKMEAAAPPGAITDATVALYAQAFSSDDIQALVQFYESPLGQRVVKALPHVAQESQRTGVQMEQKGALAVLQDMSGEYPELKSMLQPPQESGTSEAPGADKSPATAPPAR